VIAVIPETTAQEVWESEHAGAENAAHALGWNVYWNGPSREDDFPRQIQIVNQAIDRKVSGLILSPDHAVALISPVRSALAKGIPTVIVGSPLGASADGNLTFVVNDDNATGHMAAERASRYLRTGDAVAVLGVNPNILASIDRTDAFEASLRARFPGIRIVEGRSISSSYAEAEEAAEEAIRSNPNLRVVFTLNITQTRAAYWALLGTDRKSTRLNSSHW
jgi:ribose transport system substrate-binding protein